MERKNKENINRWVVVLDIHDTCAGMTFNNCESIVF